MYKIIGTPKAIDRLSKEPNFKKDLIKNLGLKDESEIETVASVYDYMDSAFGNWTHEECDNTLWCLKTEDNETNFKLPELKIKWRF